MGRQIENEDFLMDKPNTSIQQQKFDSLIIMSNRNINGTKKNEQFSLYSVEEG